MKILKLADGTSNEIVNTKYEGQRCVIVFTGKMKAEKVESIFKKKENLGVMEVYEDDIKISEIKEFTSLVEVNLVSGVVSAVLMRESTLNEQRIASAESAAVQAAKSAKSAESVSKSAEENSETANVRANENVNLINKANADIDYLAMMTEVEL